MTKILTSALFSLTLSLLLFTPIFAQPESFVPPEALALIEEVNAARVANNLPPYRVDDKLMGIAQTHADRIAKAGFLSHYARSLAPYQRAIEARYPVAGDLSRGGLFSENIDAGANLLPADLVKKWMGDSANRIALFSADYEDIGAGVATDKGITYYVLDVGAALENSELLNTVTPTPSGIIVTSAPLEDGTIYHVVRQKESLWGIALAYGITIDDLKRLNKLSSDDIYEGQKLLIHKPKPEEVKTPTPGVTFTATFGIPTSTATQPAAPTVTSTATPQPIPPASRQSGGIAAGVIILIALLGAGIGSWLGNKKQG
ncbi:MAG: LysM peptidoglycan-binding domain-containing protein [Anaerolineales bacterium]|nr:LysM peptidoglycan-binding domain-containing protein [Anaerolineales bacterium]